MMQLIKGLNPTKYTPRSYILADMDNLSEEKAIQYEKKLGKGNYSIFKIPRARIVGQPLRTVPFSMAFALLKSSKLFIQTWPDLFLGLKKIEIIYIESFARVHTLSLTGKLLYPFADRFLVQWPELSSRFQRAEYQGVLV
ncbi:hypothetical protein RO3G_11288 [Rhizopus delemar RA 99-880]|uniref:UDP-N-acetylglucosamine transferase subunit ALG14 n=1 Tax=Rhizopus delemar (strain RA 99-880 / ATCC MYA-4621 / FGSC 9543 / NRRL 43880) TaxID=246409 RepID=I1CDP7_RHIO9|nr:hypothetical protein RO3G_11288 [Rhizopus delemar RA 99-880]|eukprot:EIE86577.1 hypothetical protein RO3G_11288 [Rhizopus delemar RA 99-880]